MSEAKKKNSQKGKHDPKEQRRKRQGRQPVTPVDKKVEKESETKVLVAEKAPPPIYEPPPEFYQNLKRETDDILKITEESNAKYRKKEIQSNWAKYEMPIESYEEIDEQENLGADFQALINASLSVGGHFQFKHEKSWDVSTGPSPYDKYFQINMENLNLAISSIPFYDRNSIDLALFNESDVQSMEHRATKYKQKYYNSKEYTTPELQAKDKILNSLTSSGDEQIEDVSENNKIDDVDVPKSNEDSISLIMAATITDEAVDDSKFQSLEIADTPISINENKQNLIMQDESDNINNIAISLESLELSTVNIQSKDIEIVKKEEEKSIGVANPGCDNIKELEVPKEEPKNPIIECPEDLEKWLDDFLDG